MPLVSLHSIVKFFKDDSRLVRRGENAVASGHVVELGYDEEVLFLIGSVQASMKNKMYKVVVELSEDGSVTKATCECPAGMHMCHHMACLLIYAHKNISCTDKACAWKLKKETNDRHTIKAGVLFPPPRSFKALETSVSDSDILWFSQQLNTMAVNTGFTWLLSQEPKGSFLSLPTMTDLINSESFLKADDKISFMCRGVKLSGKDIQDLQMLTIGQRTNCYWLMYRKGRVTASNFGIVLKACNKNKYSDSLYNTLLGQYDIEGIKAIQWGVQHEDDGIKAFENATGKTVIKTGMWFHESGLLAASPDGIIDENAIIEIKCPFKYRNDDLQEAFQKNDGYIIHYNEKGECEIDTTHNYYHQIQGQLYLTGIKLCYLVFWSTKKPVMCEIPVDPSWAENIPKLVNFAMYQLLPKIIES